MKPIKRLVAGGAVIAIAAAGVAIVGAGAAQAATVNLTGVNCQINFTTLQAGPYPAHNVADSSVPTSSDSGGAPAHVSGSGAVSITTTVSPASAVGGASLTVGVTSTNWQFWNGPAADAGVGTAVISAAITFNGTNYQLDGAPNATDGGGPNTLEFDVGWNAVSTAGQIVAPTAVGAHNVAVDSIIDNSTVAGSGNGDGDALDGSFDEVCNLAALPGGLNPYTAAPLSAAAATFTTTGPTATIATETNTGADGVLGTADDTAIAAGAGGVYYVRSGDVLNITGNNAWVASPTDQFFGLTACPTTTSVVNTTCAPFGVIGSVVAPSAYATDATGQLATVNVKMASSTGAYNLILAQCSAACATGGTNVVAQSSMAINYLANRSVSGASTVNINGVSTVTGTNFYPGEHVTLSSGTNLGSDALATSALSTGCKFTYTTAAGALNNPSPIATGSIVTISGSTNGANNAGIAAAAVTGSQSAGYTFTYSYGTFGCASTAIASAADAGTVFVQPGTESGSQTPITVTADNTGSFSTNFAVTDSTANEYYAFGLSNSGKAVGANPTATPFTLKLYSTTCTTDGGVGVNTTSGDTSAAGSNTGSCATQQLINATVTAGSLTQTASGNLVNLGSVGTKATPQTLSGAINPIQVADTRGGAWGWSLVATIAGGSSGYNGFVDSTNTYKIPGADLAMSSTCGIDPAYTAVSASGFTPLAVTNFGTGATSASLTLCAKDPSVNATTGSSGGVFDVTGPMTLTVPAFQHTGAYSTLMTITIS